MTHEGRKAVELKGPPSCKLGDIVEVIEGSVSTLTPNRSNGSLQWTSRVLDPARQKALSMRMKVEAGVREFFHHRDFLETRTPLLVPSPGMEPHIRPFQVQGFTGQGSRSFLPTSPEFAMKRLLAGGLPRIFQICPAFRDEPKSMTHLPEFTILEWYRAFAGEEEIMSDIEALFEFLARKIFGEPMIEWQGKRINVAAPWPRLRVRDLFQEHARIELTECPLPRDLARECGRLGLPCDLDREDWDDLYFKIWLNCIEPKLPTDQAVLVTRYPASQAALAVIDSDPDGSPWARRFEAYAGGLELGNAFEELTDPKEQRRRFEKDMALREKAYGDEFPSTPIDEGFLSALCEGIPPSGGIAVGIDRMVMLFADEPDISRTFWL